MGNCISPVEFFPKMQLDQEKQNYVQMQNQNYQMQQMAFPQQNQKWSGVMERDWQKHLNEMEMLRLKEEMQQRREIAKERRKENRMLARKAGYENSEGFLCMEIIYPDGTKMHSKRILNVKNIRMTCMRDITDFQIKIAVVRWDGSEDNWLGEKEISPKGLKKLFDSHGVALEVCRDRKNEMIDIVWQFLMKKATYVECYPRFGWCYTKSG